MQVTARKVIMSSYGGTILRRIKYMPRGVTTYNRWARGRNWAVTILNSCNRFQLLRPLHPREFHNIKKNIFNIVTVLDLTNTNTLGFVSVTLMNLINRGYPFRFGFVPIIETEDSLKVARLLYWLSDAYGSQGAMTFLRRVSFPRVDVNFSAVWGLNCGSRWPTRIHNKALLISIHSDGNSRNLLPRKSP